MPSYLRYFCSSIDSQRNSHNVKLNVLLNGIFINFYISKISNHILRGRLVKVVSWYMFLF